MTLREKIEEITISELPYNSKIDLIIKAFESEIRGSKPDTQGMSIAKDKCQIVLDQYESNLLEALKGENHE